MNTAFYTAIEVAGFLKISKALAYRLIAQGTIRGVRFGRSVRVTEEALEDFIKEHSCSADSGDSGISDGRGKRS